MDYARSSVSNVKHCLDTSAPSPNIELRASEELRENSDTRQEALKDFKNLILDENLNCRTDDEYLIRFLRPTKFYPESALELFKSYFGHMRKNANLYAEMGPEKQSSALENDLVSVSPLRDQLGRRITIFRFGAWHPKICTIDDLNRALILCAELGAIEPTTQIAGCVVVIDLKGTSFRHVTNLSPAHAKRTVDWIQGAFPMRFKAIHVINQPRIFDLVYAFFKPLLGNKLKGRLFFHGNDLLSLHSHISPASLAREHGGLLDDYDQEGLYSILKDNEHIFKEIRSYAYQYQ